MSKTALKEYKRAREDQLTRNDARRIRARVEAAQNTAAASRRWPFELMQNAIESIAKQALGGPLMGLERNRFDLVLPSPHMPSPAKRDR